jgi:hypothetical protein
VSVCTATSCNVGFAEQTDLNNSLGHSQTDYN